MSALDLMTIGMLLLSGTVLPLIPKRDGPGVVPPPEKSHRGIFFFSSQVASLKSASTIFII